MPTKSQKIGICHNMAANCINYLTNRLHTGAQSRTVLQYDASMHSQCMADQPSHAMHTSTVLKIHCVQNFSQLQWHCYCIE